MYFIVSWDIGTTEPAWSKINEQLRDCFKGYEQIRPVNTFYMVKVANAQQYDAIHACLLKIAQNSTTVKVHFIMSPLLTVTGWKGFLPKDSWTKIAELAK
jgi:hypothetical protein